MIGGVREARRRGALIVLVAVAASLAVAGVAVVLPLPLLIALLAATGILALLAVARRFVAAGPPALQVRAWAMAGEDVRTDGLTVARVLYFAGMLTIGQTTWRTVGGFTVSDWLFFAGLCVVLADLVVRRRPVRFGVPALIVFGVALFVVSGLLSSVDAVSPLLSVAKVLRFGYLTLAWFWLGTLVLTRPRDLRIAVGLWVLSVAGDGVAAILQAAGMQLPYLGPVMWGRMTGFTEHVNDLGGAAAVAMAPAFTLAFTAVKTSTRVLWLVALLAIVAGAVLSGSVGGMAAGIGAVGVWLVIASKGPRPLVIALIALTLALAVAQVQSDLGLPTPLQRVLAATGLSQGGRYSTVATRMEGYTAAWSGVAEGGLIGVGLDEQSALVQGGTEVHNLFLKAWYEAGLGAAIGMVCVVLGGLASALLAARLAAGERLRSLVTGVVAAVAAFIAVGLSAPVLHQRYGWVAVALAVTSLAVTRAGREDEGEVPES